MANVVNRSVNRSILDGESISIFRAAVRSKYTLDPYERRLIAFLSDIGMSCDEFVGLAKKNPTDKAINLLQFYFCSLFQVHF
jgi:hypothetical protein